MGETINLFERDPRQQLREHVGSFFEFVDTLHGFSNDNAATPMHIETSEVHDPRRALFRAIISDTVSKRVFLHNNEGSSFSISHEVYSKLADRDVYVAGVDKLPENSGYKLPLDFEDTSVDSVGMLYVMQEEMPFMVEFAEGEMFDPQQEQEHRRLYLSAEDCKVLVNDLEVIKANLRS